MPIDVNLFGNERVRQASSSFTAMGPSVVPVDPNREFSLENQRDLGASINARGQDGFLTGSINQSAFSNSRNGYGNMVTGAIDSVSVNAGGAFRIGSNAVVSIPNVGFSSSSTRIDNTVTLPRLDSPQPGNFYSEPPIPRAPGGQVSNASRNNTSIEPDRRGQSGRPLSLAESQVSAPTIKPMARKDTEESRLMGVESLLSAFGKDGPAKTNRFRVEFNLPLGINADPEVVYVNTNSTNSRIRQFQNVVNSKGRVNIMCHTCTLPSREMQAFELKQYGAPYAMPFTSSYMPISFGFYSDAKLSSRTFFETWQSAVCNIGTNTFNFYNEYTSNIRIYILDSEGNETHFVDVYECWPTSLMQADYSYSSNDTVQTFMVSMRYKYWASSDNDTRISHSV